MKTAWIVLPAILLAGEPARALDIYCFNKGGSLPSGAEYTHDWIITNEKARKPPSGCRIDFDSVGGMYRPIEILARPKSGEFKSTHNAIYYRSTTSGEDQVSVRWHRLDRTGKPESSIVHLRIKVVDGPI
jgi:hypothetical protein